MTAEVDALAAWLASTLDEIERVARAAGVESWHPGLRVGDYYNIAQVSDSPATPEGWTDYAAELIAECGVLEQEGEVRAVHIALHDPAAVLARVEADRRIVRECVEWIEIGQVRPGTTWNDDAAGAECAQEVLQLLAWGLRHHPGYVAEWAPGRLHGEATR